MPVSFRGTAELTAPGIQGYSHYDMLNVSKTMSALYSAVGAFYVQQFT